MNLNTLFQTCVYFTIIMLIFTMSINFVSSLGVFGTVEMGAEVDLNNQSSTFEKLAENPMSALWDIFSSTAGITTLAGVGATLAIGALLRSPVVIGVGLFSTVFWTSYINMNSVLDLGGYVPIELLAIAHAAMLFIWVGAIIGMLSGSG